MSLDIFVNEVLAKQEYRDWLLSDPAILEEGKGALGTKMCWG